MRRRSASKKTLELDFSFGVKGLARFRCNVFSQRGAVAAVYRVIPEKIQAFDELGLPPIAGDAGRPPARTRAGDRADRQRQEHHAGGDDRQDQHRAREHILTIEDPIEFIHPHKMCLVNQREVHADTHGFKDALRAALRQDPDIVLIGELRDLETIEAA